LAASLQPLLHVHVLLSLNEVHYEFIYLFSRAVLALAGSPCETPAACAASAD